MTASQTLTQGALLLTCGHSAFAQKPPRPTETPRAVTLTLTEYNRLIDLASRPPQGALVAPVAAVLACAFASTATPREVCSRSPVTRFGPGVLRCWMGVAPVTKKSGRRRKTSAVSMRYACNRRLRDAAYHWARASAQRDPRSRAYYQQLRGRGHTHGRALRSVTDRALRILVTLLTRGQLFDAGYAQHASTPVAVGA
jgi:hypothetical protein